MLKKFFLLKDASRYNTHASETDAQKSVPLFCSLFCFFEEGSILRSFPHFLLWLDFQQRSPLFEAVLHEEPREWNIMMAMAIVRRSLNPRVTTTAIFVGLLLGVNFFLLFKPLCNDSGTVTAAESHLNAVHLPKNLSNAVSTGGADYVEARLHNIMMSDPHIFNQLGIH